MMIKLNKKDDIMPLNLIRDLTKKTKVPEKKLDQVFHKVAEHAKESGAKEPYAVATSVVEKYAHNHKKD